MADTFNLTIQLPLAGGWGTDEQRALYEKVEEAIHTGFEANDFGFFDGNDFGSGTMNLFIYDVPVARWNDAFSFVRETLNAHEVLAKAIIARGEKDETGEVTKDVVVWPPGFKGEFSLLKL